MKLSVVLLLMAVLSAYVYYKFNQLMGPMPLPKFDTNKYWGPGDVSNYKSDGTITPFKVKRSTAEIEDLRTQLNRSLAYTKPLEGIKFEYGFNSDLLKEIVKYWRDDYLPRWRQREDYLNSFAQYTTEIQGLNIHFIHVKPDLKDIKGKKVLPLLLLHGWPGSVREFYEIIPLLTKPNEWNDYVFEVVAPSLVGYGWSDGATRTGFSSSEMAIVMRNLMLRLGFKKFLIQGGDWGSIIGMDLSTIFPDNVLAYHSNMCLLNSPLAMLKNYIASFAPTMFVPENGFHHHFPPSLKFKSMIQETGYLHLQATKPDTIGAALLNSPDGLAAYILEKFQTVCGRNNQEFTALHEAYTMDALLDNLMIYYLSKTATTAARFYGENFSAKHLALAMNRVPSPVQVGCVRFLYDLTPATAWALKDKFPNLIHNSYFTEGGHFAALEKPTLLYIDFIEFLQKVKF